MPVRSLRSSVLAWPKKGDVEAALKAWAGDLAAACEDLLGVGYFGSYARGDWGVGSDLDLLVVLERSDQDFGSRVLSGGTSAIPVPVDVFIYTREELTHLMARGGRFPAALRREAVWVWLRSDFPGLPDG
jgi:hypothetical protein